jgi:hypothetical protein
MEYVSVGTDCILDEYFIPAVNSDKKIKPSGGLWCSLYRGEYYNEWLDFISNKPIYLRRYLRKENPYELSGAIITPKENAKILTLDSAESFSILENLYNFDYEKVADDFDAIYYDLFQLTGAIPRYSDDIRRFISVTTFLVLNPSSIKEYKKAKINIRPMDYEYEWCEDIEGTTTILPGTYEVEPASEEYTAILNEICLHFSDEIARLKIEYSNLPTYRIVEIFRKKIEETFGNEIISYCKSKKYDSDRVLASLTVRSYKRAK